MTKTDRPYLQTTPEVALASQLMRDYLPWFEQQVLLRCLFDSAFWHQSGEAIGYLRGDGPLVPIQRFTEPLHQALYDTLYEVRKMYTGALDGSALWHALVGFLQQRAARGESLALSDVPVAQQLLHQLYESSGALEAAQQVTRAGLVEWVMHSSSLYLYSMMSAGRLTASDAQRMLANEQKLLLSATNAARMFSFGHGFDNPLPLLPRLTTGLTALDFALGGGPGRGEALLTIACTGVGKTAFGTQVLGNMLMRSASIADMPGVLGSKVKGLYITTESSQRHHQLETRFMSNLANIPYSAIRDGLHYDRLTTTQQQDYQSVRGLLNSSNLTIFEWDKNDTTSSANPRQYLLDIIHKAQDAMSGLDIVVLDWVGGAVPDSVEADSKRLQYKETGNGFCRACGDEYLVGFAFGQAHVSFVNKTVVDSRAISECKSLADEFTAQLGITALTNTEREISDARAAGKKIGIYKTDQFLYMGKSRQGEGDLVQIKRNLAYQRFEGHTQGQAKNEAQQQQTFGGQAGLRGPNG
jgi:hypothetical protein